MSFENAALSAATAAGLADYGELCFRHWQITRQVPEMIDHFESLGMGTQANRAGKIQRSIQETTVTGHFLEFAGRMIRERHPAMTTITGMELLRQYSRVAMAYYFADVDEERKTALERQLNEYDTAITEAMKDQGVSDD